MKPLTFVNKTYNDNRGELYSFWKFDNINFVEDRISRSTKGVIRGFHGDCITTKLCGCIYGSFFLVLWDLSKNTKYEYLLTDKNKLQVLIPPNYLNAHQCLSKECILLYKWDQYYKGPNNQRSINYKDPTINVDWAIKEAILSERDINSEFLQ